MPVTYELLLHVPEQLLSQWSEATFTESHLVPESAESLKEKVVAAAVARDGARAVGFAGLLLARTRDGHPVQWAGRPVVELGGAFTQAVYRRQGIWLELVNMRLAHAKEQDWCVVCISGNPAVQDGLRDLGATAITDARYPGLCHELCLSCVAASGCKFCPKSPGTAWIIGV